MIIAYEGYKTGGVGSEIAAFIAEECIESLSAPILRVAYKDVPYASNKSLISGMSIGKKDVVAAIRSALNA